MINLQLWPDTDMEEQRKKAIIMMFRRKMYQYLLNWKKEKQGHTALLIEGAKGVGKTAIVEAFARNEYQSYILIDFSITLKDVAALFG